MIATGRLLRAYATSEGRWRLPAKVADVDPKFFDLLFAYEDKRFRPHHGVDPLALMRAAGQLGTSGRIRSGGSTLTMQVARLLEPRNNRNLSAKLRQIVRAIEIERVLCKDQMLVALSRTCAVWRQYRGYSCRLARLFRQGAAAGSRWARRRCWSRCRNRRSCAGRTASPRRRVSPRDRVLDRYAAAGKVPADEIAFAKAEAVPTARRAMPHAGAARGRSGHAAEPGRK